MKFSIEVWKEETKVCEGMFEAEPLELDSTLPSGELRLPWTYTVSPLVATIKKWQSDFTKFIKFPVGEEEVLYCKCGRKICGSAWMEVDLVADDVIRVLCEECCNAVKTVRT